MKINRYAVMAVLAAVMLTAPDAGAQTTQRFTANKANEFALVYSLPRTVLDITVETEHTIEQPGDYANYANRHLSVTDAIRRPSHTVIIKSINITPRGEADPDNRWQVQFKNGSQVSMMLTDAGIPLAINTDRVTPAKTPELPQAVAAKPTPLETDAARQAVTVDISRATSQAKKAELTAQRIFELREQRGELISGNADNMPPDGRALQVALDNLSAQEAALTAMFTGTRKTYTEVSTVTFNPGVNDSTDVVVARISPVDGVVDVNDLSGEPLYLTMTVVERGKLPVNDKGEEKRFPKGGVAYTIPGSAQIQLSYQGKVLGSQTYTLGQLGVTFGIDPALFSDRKAPSLLEFSPVTGAIVRLDSATPQPQQ